MSKYGPKKTATDVELVKPDEPAVKQKKAVFTAAASIAAAGEDSYIPAYEKAEAGTRSRIVAATMAQQKRGKTTFAFSMPKPLAYLQLDNNYEHALKAARKKYGIDSIRHLSYSSSDPRVDLHAEAKTRWARFIQDYSYCVKNFKSVVVDTMTELYDLRRLAEFGRTTQIMQLFYGPIYSDLRWMVTHALRHDANVLFLHRMGDEYINNQKTGGLKLQGWAGIAYESQMLLEHTRDEDNNFITTIRESSSDAMLIGMELDAAEEENDFPTLATRVYPETERSDWEE